MLAAPMIPRQDPHGTCDRDAPSRIWPQVGLFLYGVVRTLWLTVAAGAGATLW